MKAYLLWQVITGMAALTGTKHESLNRSKETELCVGSFNHRSITETLHSPMGAKERGGTREDSRKTRTYEKDKAKLISTQTK